MIVVTKKKNNNVVPYGADILFSKYVTHILGTRKPLLFIEISYDCTNSNLQIFVCYIAY